jgi:cardiolipin synthase
VAAPSDVEPASDRILTVPNLITLVRLAMFPVFLWLLFGRDDRWAAAWLLLVLGGTDWVDGWYARRFNQVSELGKVLDPVADRVLLGGGIIAILVDGSVPPWVAWVMIIREAGISVATVALAAMGARRIDVQWVGKAGTFWLMGAFPAFLASEAGRSTDGLFEVVAWMAAVPGLALSYYAAVTYVPLGRKALAEGRADRAAAAVGRGTP